MSDEFQTSGTMGDVVTKSTKSDKSWGIALLCCIPGLLGIHRFYLGRVGSGVTMLLLFVIGWLTLGLIIGGIMLLIDIIWLAIDILRILFNGMTDGEGRKLR